MQEYTIDEKNFERQQLLAKNLAPLTLQALERMQLSPGATILDVACGIGETTRLLAEHYENSTVVGVDIDASLIQTAKALTGNSDHIHFITANATQLPFEEESFDMVFSRYLLMHVTEPVAILTEMKRVCKPGGIVFVQEPDISSSSCYPHSWAYDKLVEYFNALFVDGLIGRKLPALLAGIELQVGGYHAGAAFEAQSNNSLRRMYTLTGEALGGALLAKQLAKKEEHIAWVEELRRVENDTNTAHLTHPVVAAWAVK